MAVGDMLLAFSSHAMFSECFLTYVYSQPTRAWIKFIYFFIRYTPIIHTA